MAVWRRLVGVVPWYVVEARNCFLHSSSSNSSDDLAVAGRDVALWRWRNNGGPGLKLKSVFGVGGRLPRRLWFK